MPLGRKPKSTFQKKIEGNPGKRPMNEDEPEAVEGLPECPAHVTGEAKAEWERTGAQLIKEGRMALVYKAVFAAYCVSWGRWVEAEQEIQKFGMVIKTPNGHLAQSPYLPIANKAWDHMMKAVVELGIGPSSQSRVSMVAPKVEQQSALGRIQDKRRGLRAVRKTV
jgi:P27 family predicted phage terminase small subunit